MTCKNDVTKTQSDFVEFMKAHKIPKDDKIIEQICNYLSLSINIHSNYEPNLSKKNIGFLVCIF